MLGGHSYASYLPGNPFPRCQRLGSIRNGTKNARRRYNSDIQDDVILQPSSQPTQMSVIMFKLHLFEISSRVCDHLSSDSKMDEDRLCSFDSLIAEEHVKLMPNCSNTPIGFTFFSAKHSADLIPESRLGSSRN